MRYLLLLITYLTVSLPLICQDYSAWFSDETSNSGLIDSRGSKVSVADVNGDGWPDILVGNGSLIKFTFSLYINEDNGSGQRIFVDRTEESGINQRRGDQEGDRISDVISLADVDNDGDLDLISSIYYHRWEMYNTPEKDPGDRSEILLNDGQGNFTLSEDNGLWNTTIPAENSPALTNATGIATVDFDLDGDLDIYISQWFEDYRQNLEVNNFQFKFEDILFENDGTGKFTFVSNSGLAPYKEANYGVNILDWNNDGYPDIATSAYCRSGGYLFANEGGLQFSEVSGPASYNSQPMGGDHGQALCQWEGMPADYDNDGDFDIFHTLVHGGMGNGEARSFISENGGEENNFTFTPRLDIIQRDQRLGAHVSDMGASWIDIDNDGLQDLIVAQSGYLEANPLHTVNLFVFYQTPDHRFIDITKQTGTPDIVLDPHSPIPIDYDLDGDNDLVTSYTYRDTIMLDSMAYDPMTKDSILVEYEQPRAWSTLKLIRNNIGNQNNWISLNLDEIPDAVNHFAIGSRIEVYSDDLVQTRELHNSQGHFGGQEDHILNIGLGDKPFVDSILVYLPDKSRTLKKFFNPDINSFNQLNINSESIKSSSNAGLQFNIAKADFGRVDVGDSKKMTITAVNKSDHPIVVSGFSYPEDIVFEYDMKQEFPMNLTSGESFDFDIIVSPSYRHLFQNKVTFDISGAKSASRDFIARVQGFEPKPLIALAERSVKMTPVWVDSLSTYQIEIANIGEVDLLIEDHTFTSNNDVFFFESEGNLIPSMGSITADISFIPGEVKTYTTTLQLTTNAYNDTINSIDISGICNGPNPRGSISGFVSFGKIKVGNSATKSVTVISDGTSDLVIDKLRVENFPEAFNLDKNTLPITLEPTASTQLEVTFAPKEIDKVYNTKLIVESNQVGEPITQSMLAISDKTSSVAHDYSKNLYYSAVEEKLTLWRNSGLNRLDSRYDIRLLDISGRLIIPNQVWQKGNETLDIPLSGIVGFIMVVIIDSESGEAQTVKLLTK